MPANGTDDRVREASGVLQQVDVAGREVRALVDGQLMAFDVAPDCAILLHGERVKLRLLLPMDCTRITYTDADGRRVACSIAVNWWFPESSGEVETVRARQPKRSMR
jgi:hypothetical protein